jgi:Na+/glutamate symporter|tara:strand:+ start:250 stop:450 length:201 start_codon:yes stop_codon:yes gene_type:complete
LYSLSRKRRIGDGFLKLFLIFSGSSLELIVAPVEIVEIVVVVVVSIALYLFFFVLSLYRPRGSYSE